MKEAKEEANGQGMIEEDRYKRQTLLWGKGGQAKLANSRVAVVGLGPQGVYTALCMAALGVGNIVLVDGSETETGEMFLDMPLPTGLKARSYPELLGKINAQINIEGYPVTLESKIDQVALAGANVIVDATNSVRSKELAILYGKEKNIPVLSVSSKSGYTKLVFCDPKENNPEYLMPMFSSQEQDPLMALSMCGVTAEEVRKIIFGEIQNIIRNPVRYVLGEGYRFGFPKNGKEAPRPDKTLYENLSAAFLGGGALGCWGAIAGAMMGFGRLDVYDYDKFEPHNINRQVLAYDGIDKLKAGHIAKKISKMSRGKTKSTGHNMLILPGFDPKTKYDVVFDFVDNRYTRAINSAYAVSHGIPLISAGALPASARWDTHVAGKTKCMGCLYNIYEEGRKEEMIRRASCAENPNPSVVMSNAVAGINALLDAFTVFEPEKFGEPFNGEQTYRSTSPKRFGTSPLKGPCDCYSKPVPNLEVSQEDIEKFITENPGVLKGA